MPDPGHRPDDRGEGGQWRISRPRFRSQLTSSPARPAPGECSGMNYQLTPVDPTSRPPIALHRPVLLIGRHPECDVRIDLPKISRRHCCLALAYDRVLIRDLGSRNGLRVNGLLVEEAQLQGGDEVAIGPILFRMEHENPTQPPPPPPPPPPASPPPPPLPLSSANAGKPLSLPSLPIGSEDDLIPLADL